LEWNGEVPQSVEFSCITLHFASVACINEQTLKTPRKQQRNMHDFTAFGQQTEIFERGLIRSTPAFVNFVAFMGLALPHHSKFHSQLSTIGSVLSVLLKFIVDLL